MTTLTNAQQARIREIEKKVEDGNTLLTADERNQYFDLLAIKLAAKLGLPREDSGASYHTTLLLIHVTLSNAFTTGALHGMNRAHKTFDKVINHVFGKA